jgi:Coenzyme PQQ synthesis protein D (PqqD)
MTARTHFSMSTVVVSSDQQISCDVGEEAVLLSTRDGEYYGLNPVAASVWRMLRHPSSLEEVRDALLSEYAGVSPAECERALIDLVSELITLGVVRTA